MTARESIDFKFEFGRLCERVDHLAVKLDAHTQEHDTGTKHKREFKMYGLTSTVAAVVGSLSWIGLGHIWPGV